MRDFVEIMEDAAEDRMWKMLQPDGMLKCACGQLFNPMFEGTVLSPSPYGLPYCNKCADAHFKALKKI